MNGTVATAGGFAQKKKARREGGPDCLFGFSCKERPAIAVCNSSFEHVLQHVEPAAWFSTSNQGLSAAIAVKIPGSYRTVQGLGYESRTGQGKIVSTFQRSTHDNFHRTLYAITSPRCVGDTSIFLRNQQIVTVRRRHESFSHSDGKTFQTVRRRNKCPLN
jgi:hypothetical protein